jgi:CHAP domain
MQTSSSMVTGEGSLGLVRRTAAFVLSIAVSAALLIFGSTSPAAAATRTFSGIGLTGNGQGYLLVSSAGEFYAYGNAHPWTNAVGSSGIASVAVTADGQGALAVSNSGQFYAYGAAHPWTNIVGSSGIVGVAVTADGQGALAVSRTGQFYAYGTAHPWTNIVGSSPIVGVAITADGQGALAVSDTGQFYAYGTAHAWTNPTGFTNRITSVAMTADGQGAVAMSDRGQFYAYGTARPQTNPTGFTGSMVGVKLTADGQGLTAMSSSGQIYAYGTSKWLGNGDPGSPDAVAQRIVSLARAEAADASHNVEKGGTNCNYYTGQMEPTATACSGGTGWRARAWCADFANYVWQRAGVRTTRSGLAQSFANLPTYRKGASTANARVGDAVVFNQQTATVDDDHVGLVTAVNPDGTISYVSGNTGNPTPKGRDGVFEKTINPVTNRPQQVSGYASPAA